MAEQSVSDIIRINVSIAPTGLARRETGVSLFVTNVAGYKGPNGRVDRYSNITGVGEDYASTDEAYKAALVHFSQDPYPRNFLVGVNGLGDGTEVPVSNVGLERTAQNQTDLQAITDGECHLNWTVVDAEGAIVNDNQYTTSPLDFTGQDMDGIAAILDAEFKALASTDEAFTPTCTWDSENNRFLLSAVTAPSVAFPDAAYLTNIDVATGSGGGPPENIGTLLGLAVADGAAVTSGAVESQETTFAALDAIASVDDGFTFVCEDHAFSDTDVVKDIASWCLANRRYIGSSASAEPNVLTETAGTTYNDLFVAQNANAFGTWSASNDYKNVSAAARLSSVNFSQSNSQITMMYKRLPTCTPDGFTTSQKKALEDQRVNVYLTRSGIPMYEQGKTFSSDWWIDQKYWAIWFENALQTAIFNLLYASNKVDQTDIGMEQIKSVIEGVCEEGVRNGGIAPGRLSPATTNDVRNTTGNQEFDGVLSQGFFVWYDSVATQDQSERAQRIAPPFKVWCKGAGAIHEVDVAVVLEQ